MKKMPNVHAMLFGGELQIFYECPGKKKCVHARFYTDPPEHDEECAFCKNLSQCVHAPAQKAALIELCQRLQKEINGEFNLD